MENTAIKLRAATKACRIKYYNISQMCDCRQWNANAHLFFYFSVTCAFFSFFTNELSTCANLQLMTENIHYGWHKILWHKIPRKTKQITQGLSRKDFFSKGVIVIKFIINELKPNPLKPETPLKCRAADDISLPTNQWEWERDTKI